ncbi:MAG: ATP-binding protein [Pseudomonadales bacterium]|nr:ATP-binding protein [Pseudomonadales bacterium]
MLRFAINDLVEWKLSKKRQPLVIRGARQVGKTWLMKEFGKQYYKKIAYVNFDNNKRMERLFSDDIDISRIIAGLNLETGVSIEESDTLIIFDEIQENPKALTSLKYFNENAPGYHLVAAGSLLGVALHNGVSFPVGKVKFLDLYPLDFVEFLQALDRLDYVKLLRDGDWEMISTFKDKYIDLLKQYYVVGGMPYVVSTFIENRDYSEVREIQNQILGAYEQDFSKHAPHSQVPRIRMLWNSVPSQLGKENKKFIYGLVKEGARAKDYELAITWLVDCGLVSKVSRASKPAIPLKAYEDLKAFKLFILDVGMLGALSELPPKTLLDGNKIFTEFKGALTEQYVCQQLKTNKNISTYYWSAERGNAEVDFLAQINDAVVPIEVKAEVNLQAKSLRTFKDKYYPNIAVRTSMRDYRIDDWIMNLPLYGVNFIEQALLTK